MNKKLLSFLLLIIIPASSVSADTGTYEILEYKVNLTTQEDGVIKLDYFQKWHVNSGHIPWVTVGLPNSRYKVIKGSNKGNALRTIVYNSNNWSGVRVTLDKDYKQGETFTVGFSVQQRGLIYSHKDKYLLDYIVGWYDRAVIRQLDVILTPHFEVNKIETATKADVKTEKQLAWKRTSLKPGAKFRLNIYMPKTAYSKSLSPPKYKKNHGNICPFISVIVIVLFIIFFVFIMSESHKSSYGSGGTIHGAGVGHRVYRSTCVCACACVSCACACACAGGGAAGCDNKERHNCEKCSTFNDYLRKSDIDG